MHAAMIEHIVELQFRMNDVKHSNREMRHVHFYENEHEKREKQQNNYEKWNKLTMPPFALS
jgi:hypothetical protein